MGFKPHDADLGGLFNGPRIEVPPYQRSYSWRKAQVETLWEDITEYFAGRSKVDIESKELYYFLGTIVSVSQGYKSLLLLDGQQRLATLAIFLSILRDYAKSLRLIGAELAGDIDELLYAKVGRKGQTTRLALNKEDRRYFEDILKNPATSLPEAQSISNKLLKSTKEILSDLIHDHLAKYARKARLSELERLTDIVSHGLKFLTVTVSNEQEACDIFEHLNNRGVALGLADLLRNMLFKKSPDSKHEALVDEWDSLMRLFPQGGISDLIRYSWISRNKRISRGKTYTAINSSVKDASVGIYLDQLKADAKAYDQLMDPPKAPLDATKRAILTFQTLGVKQCIPLLIASLEAAPDSFHSLRA